MENRYPERTPEIGERIMRVADWSVYHPEHDDRQVIKDVGFDYGMSPRAVADGVVAGHEVLWEKTVEITVK